MQQESKGDEGETGATGATGAKERRWKPSLAQSWTIITVHAVKVGLDKNSGSGSR